MQPRTLFLFLAIAFLAFSGCLQKKSIKGDQYVDRETLVSVLVDMHLAEGVINDRKFQRRYEADSVDVLIPIFEKYGITREMFDTTMFIYSKYPDLMDEVYNDVLIRLNVMLDENDREQEVSTPEE
jgi:hypothetical protein